jgi:hypothetical protein
MCLRCVALLYAIALSDHVLRALAVLSTNRQVYVTAIM